MDISTSNLLRMLVPRLPLLLKTAILNALSISPNSSKQDLQTEITVIILRSLLNVNKKMGHMQHISTKDPGIKGRVAVAKVTIPPPIDEGGPRDAIVRAIKELGNGTEKYTLPEIVPVSAEWTGYLRGKAKDEPRPNVSEQDHYKNLDGRCFE